MRKNQGGFGSIALGASQLAGGLASRTASRGGSNQLGDRTQSFDGPKPAEDNQYKKLVVNPALVEKPQPEISEKEKSHADYQQLMQNYAGSNFVAPAVGNAKEAVRQKSKCALI